MTPTQHEVIGTALTQNLLLACNPTIRTRDMLGSAQLNTDMAMAILSQAQGMMTTSERRTRGILSVLQVPNFNSNLQEVWQKDE